MNHWISLVKDRNSVSYVGEASERESLDSFFLLKRMKMFIGSIALSKETIYLSIESQTQDEEKENWKKKKETKND